MKTTRPVTCPLCRRAVQTRLTGDGCHVLPTHGHTVSRGWARGGRGKCLASGWSVEGLAIRQTICDAFGALRP